MKNLTQFLNRTWTIICRIVKKYEKRSYVKRGTDENCNLFSFDCCDDSREIRFVAFEKECDKFFDKITESQVYEISSRGGITFRNERFNHTKHDYEVSFQSNTTVELITDTSITEKVPLFYAQLKTFAQCFRRPSSGLIGRLLTILIPNQCI